MANKRMLRTAVTMAVAVVVLVALWEGYKGARPLAAGPRLARAAHL